MQPAADIDARHRQDVGWPNGCRLAVSVCVHYEEGAERSVADGDDRQEEESEGFALPRGTRDLHGESLYEYGARAGIWRILRILSTHDVRATFFCCGQALLRNPGVGSAITAAGHEAAAHGYRWLAHYDMTEAEQEADVLKAVEAIRETTGQRPVGWNSRVPGEKTRALLLKEGGFLYDSDAYDDEVPYFVGEGESRFLTIPYTLDSTDSRFWLPPPNPGYANPEVFFRVLKGNFDRLYRDSAASGRMMSISLRPRISGRPCRAWQVDRFLTYARSFGGVWFATRAEIARWWSYRLNPEKPAWER